MTWLQSFVVAAMLVAAVYYGVRAAGMHRAREANWKRWAWVTALFALAFVINLVALVMQA